jgi:hypothetical protein
VIPEKAPEILTAPPTAPAPAAAAPAPPPTGDLASFIAARRQARGEPAESTTAQDENAQYNRNIAANLPSGATGVISRSVNTGGGIFEIKRMAYDDAVFQFFGWNKEVGQRTPQTFEVRKGSNPDMEIAVVRRMIVIIREHEKEDFIWESKRLGRNVKLSARVEDTAGLEAFMLQEFFDGARVR